MEDIATQNAKSLGAGVSRAGDSGLTLLVGIITAFTVRCSKQNLFAVYRLI